MTPNDDEPEHAIARPLAVLAPLIQNDLNQAHEAAWDAARPYFQAAGEKLIQAKAQLSHGQFLPWVKENLNVGKRQAQLYMKLARENTDVGKRSPDRFSSIRQMRRITEQNFDAAPLDTETSSIRSEQLTREMEVSPQRELGLLLIDTGYKALARKLHPDKGGSPDAMVQLSAVRDRLKRSL